MDGYLFNNELRMLWGFSGTHAKMVHICMAQWKKEDSENRDVLHAFEWTLCYGCFMSVFLTII